MIDLLEDIPFLTPISERNLHSDRYMERVRDDLPGFLKTYFNFPDDGWKPQHVYDALDLMFEGGKLVFQWATDHAKSDTGTFYFPIASMAENPDESHIVLGSNFADAKRRLQKVSRELENNQALLRDFPWLKKPVKPKGSSGGITWSRTEITVAGRSANKANPSLYACATGSDDIRGRRGKLIMDDIEGKDHRLRATLRQALYEFVKLEAVRCMEDRAESERPLLCAMGTPFDIDSIYLKLQDEDWQVIKVPAYAVPWDKIHQSAYMTKKHGDTTQTPWQVRASRLPERYFTWPRKRLKVCENDPHFGRGMDRSQFSISYLLDPTVGDPMRLSVQQMRKLVAETEFGGEGAWLTVVALDPAAGVGEDYAGVSVIRIRWPHSDKYPQVEVLEAYPFTQGLFEQVTFVADLCHQYADENKKPARLIYESNAQQGGTYRNAFSHMRPEIALLPIYTSTGAKFDTEMGLTVIRTLVKQHLLKVPESQLDSEGMQTLLREVRDLGTSAHDHIACSVWFVIRWLYDQVRAYNGPPLVAASAVPRFGWGSGRTGSGGQVPSWKTWRSR